MRIRKFSVAAILLWVALALTSVLASPDIAIINPSNGKSIYLPNGSLRQVVVRTDKATASFTTLTKENAAFVLRTYDAQAKPLGTATMAAFTDGYAGGNDYALASNSRRIVYKKKSGTHMHLLDIPTNSETVLWENAISKYGRDIKGLYWLADDRVLALLGFYPETERNEITLIDVSSGNRKILYRPVDYGHSNALSPDRNLLAFQEATKKLSIYSTVKVLDLRSGEVIANFGSGTQLMGPLQWSPDGSELAYVDGNEIKLWRRENQTTRLLKLLDEGFLVYSLVFTRDMVGYVGGFTGKKEGLFDNLFGYKKLILIDARNGNEVRKVSEQFNGRLYYLDAVDRIVAEIGI
ncbi:MAG: hypothetical protein EG825_09445 [Rhodocyclaceae bacterium]|nr:hypothetical protein [Rhodocyclaceae bacterium]